MFDINIQNVVLTDKPPITSTIKSLPPALLEQLLDQISTLASVYHKPPETFVGQGKYGADAVQKRAIEYVLPFLYHIHSSLLSGSSFQKPVYFNLTFPFTISC